MAIRHIAKRFQPMLLAAALSGCTPDHVPIPASGPPATPSSPAGQSRVAHHEEGPPSQEPLYEESTVSQISLDNLMANTKRIVVRKSEVNDTILYESNGKGDLALLAEVLRILPPDKKAKPCHCVGSPIIELYYRKHYVGWIAVHDGVSIRTSRWNSDGRIADPERFLKWFDRRGIAGPRRRATTENTNNIKQLNKTKQ